MIFNANLLSSSGYDTLQNKYLGPLLRKEYAIPFCFKGDTPWEKELLTHLAALIHFSLTQPFTYELSVKAYLYLIVSRPKADLTS